MGPIIGSLLESSITGILAGGFLLGVLGFWFGLAVMMLTSWWGSWVNWGDIVRITLISCGIGATLGLIVGVLLGMVQHNASHVIIGSVTGAISLCFGFVSLSFIDSSSRSVQINRAVFNGVIGAVIGLLLGGFIGWLVGLLMAVI